MADKNTIRSSESAHEGLGFVSKKPSLFGRLSDKVRKIAESVQAKLATVGLAGMVGASAAQAETMHQDLVRKDQMQNETPFAMSNTSRLDTRFNVFEHDDRVGASASIIQSAGSTALGIGAAANSDSANIKAAIAHQYRHGGVVGANILVNQSSDARTNGKLQGARAGVDYSHLIDGSTSIDLGASYTRTFDSKLGTTSDTSSTTRTILENGSNNTYRDTITKNTTTRYIGGGQAEYYLGATSRLSDNFAISAGASYGEQMTGYGSATFANGEYAAGLGVRNIGETPRYDFFADKAVGAHTAIGVFGSGTSKKDAF